MKIIYNHDNGFLLNERVFCEVFCIPEDESNDELLNKGWLPSIEERGKWYQARSCRINIEEFILSKKRKNKLNKFSVLYDSDNELLIKSFFIEYYKKMNLDLEYFFNNCTEFFDTKVFKLIYNNELVGIGRYAEYDNSNIFLNLSYVDKYEKLSLGTTLFYLLIKISQLQNKKYLYLYETYNNMFSYKQKLPNVEVWNGQNWIKVKNNQTI